jgi:ubiquinone/menaquinone biosynthesis C-methylase UbiE
MKQEEVWNAIAKKWANFRIKPTGEVLDFLKNRKGLVLDLGCGSGRHFLYDKNLKFYGIDFSEELIKIAREKDYVEVRVGNVSEIFYENDFFDFIVFSRVLHCIERIKDRRKSLEEIYRVLKDGGRALITAWGRGSGRVKNKEKESFIPWTVDGKKYKRYTYVYDFEELEAELLDVGFDILKSWEDGCSCFVVRKN